jgi:hypothetical protein
VTLNDLTRELLADLDVTTSDDDDYDPDDQLDEDQMPQNLILNSRTAKPNNMG